LYKNLDSAILSVYTTTIKLTETSLFYCSN
jgi:hypothetical protein